jgi:transcriptional regulator of acetoin/glycerol metabolism
VRDLPPRILGKTSDDPALGRLAPGQAGDSSTSPLNLEIMEKSFIGQALQQTRGNVTEAAKLLGISRRTLHRKIKGYGLKHS